MNTMIKCLPAEVQGKLRSGVAVPSLQQCVEELILNSIDAEATCVGVRMDMEAFKVQVIDNGAGMNVEDLECVGKRYYTSKCNSIEDLDNLTWYGFRGEALASVVSLATLVEISSRTRSSVKTHIKIFKDGKGMDVFEAETARPTAGTTVVICNFFYNMPVRRKRMDAVLEGERIRQRVEAISLMHPSVSFSLKNDCTGAMMVQLPKARNTYHRFVQIHSLGRAQKLGEISYTHAQFEVTGYIGREGHYNNSLQFLYVNERLLLKTRVHKLLNFLLRRLSSSNQRNDSPEEQSAIRSPKHKRSQDLHGVYIINIKCSYSEYDICLEPAKSLIEFKDWDGILLCVEEAVKAFLSRENLVSVLSQDDQDDISPKLFATHNTDQEVHKSDSCGQAAGSASALDCSIGMKLASDSVYRKRKEDGACEDSVCQESDVVQCKDETEQVGQRKITAHELEEIKSEESRNKECRNEQLSDQAELESVSDNNVTEEEELTVSEAGEDSKVLCLPSSVRQPENKSPELSKDMEIKLNSTASTGNVIPPGSLTQQIQPDLNCTEQILPDHCGAGEHGQTLVTNRKICLSDPYVHECLQTQDTSHINKSTFQVQLSAHKCEERSSALKHKISLNLGHERSCQNLCRDFDPVIPAKILKISCQKSPLCIESGSLEKFRKVYCKSNEQKLPFQEHDASLSQTDGFVLNSKNLLNCQKEKEKEDEDVTEKAEAQDRLRSPPTRSVFTKLKPISAQNKSKKSLAAKLCHLKQHKTDTSKVLPHLSSTTSQDRSCLSGGNSDIQDSNNNKNPCDDAQNPEPVPGCSTNPQQVDREEATTSGDWLHHYDTSVGKTVYINKVTGLSRYEEPAAEETQVRCTSDVTNMAVSVVSEMGELGSCVYLQFMLT